MFEESVLGGRRPSSGKESSMMQQHGLPGPKGEKGEAGLPGDLKDLVKIIKRCFILEFLNVVIIKSVFARL